jgi:hypothetical protein
MLGQVQRQSGPRHLDVRRRVLLEVVFPIDGETEEADVADVEVFHLRHVEDAQDRDRLLKFNHSPPS